MSTLSVDTIQGQTTAANVLITGHVIQHKVHNLTTQTISSGVKDLYV